MDGNGNMQFLTRRQVNRWVKTTLRCAAMGYGNKSASYHLTVKKTLARKREVMARISTSGY